MLALVTAHLRGYLAPTSHPIRTLKRRSCTAIAAQAPSRFDVMRTIFEEEHQLFRESFRDFVANEMAPRFEEWEDDGVMDRQVYADAAKYGFIGFNFPEKYGGAGIIDFRFNTIVAEELARANLGGAGNGVTLVNDITTPYFLEYCTDDQAERWMPGLASGELISAIAMTEPGTGSDLAGIQSTATRDGDDWILNGSKTFITNGINSDLVIVVCRTNPEAGRDGMSLLVVERGMDGFERGRNLDKIGQHSADTAELSFSDVRVPAANVMGEEGRALEYLASNLAQERLSIGIMGQAVATAALGWTVDYVKERTAFGKPIASFQNTKFALSEIATEVEVTQPFMDQCVVELNAGELTPAKAAMAKLWGSEVQTRIRCLRRRPDRHDLRRHQRDHEDHHLQRRVELSNRRRARLRLGVGTQQFTELGRASSSGGHAAVTAGFGGRRPLFLESAFAQQDFLGDRGDVGAVVGEHVAERRAPAAAHRAALPLIQVPLVRSHRTVEPHGVIQAGTDESILVVLGIHVERMRAASRVELHGVRRKGEPAHVMQRVLSERVGQLHPAHRLASAGV